MSSEKRTSVPNSLNEHWMPFTSNKDFKENPKLNSGGERCVFKKSPRYKLKLMLAQDYFAIL